MYSVGIAYLLWLFSGCGALGFHRFYLGKIPTGLLWMFTGGLGMIGSVFDFFTLPGQVREANFRNALYERRSQNPARREERQENWRYGSDAQYNVVNGKNHEKESPERVILKLAKESNGILTVSEVALSANITIDESKKILDTLVTKGFAELRVRKSGSLVYVIPDMADKDEPLEDF
ncbi:MAG: TM2 domain-containing protein [Treponema sp.]|jgi:predicted transcriptional regulator|nr:TM2 domain-containing protein [Treponema sp.]